MKYQISRWERLSDEMVAVLKEKTGIEKLKIASGMRSMAWRVILISLQKEHPEWPLKKCREMTARRMSHGAV